MGVTDSEKSADETIKTAKTENNLNINSFSDSEDREVSSIKTGKHLKTDTPKIDQNNETKSIEADSLFAPSPLTPEIESRQNSPSPNQFNINEKCASCSEKDKQIEKMK